MLQFRLISLSDELSKCYFLYNRLRMLEDASFLFLTLSLRRRTDVDGDGDAQAEANGKKAFEGLSL